MKKLCLSVLPFLIVLFIFSVPGSPTQAFADDCTQLVEYRDGQLYSDFEIAFDKHEIFEKGKADLAKLKRDLISDTKTWYRLSGSNDWANVVAHMAQHIKTNTNFFGNLLGFHPATGVIRDAGEATMITAEQIYSGLKAGKTIYSLSKNGLEETYTKLLLARAGPVGRAAKTVWDLAGDIQKLAYLEEDHQQLKQDMRSALDNLDRQFQLLERKMIAEKGRINTINDIKEGIDRFCSGQKKGDDSRIMGVWVGQRVTEGDCQELIFSNRLVINEKVGEGEYLGTIYSTVISQSPTCPGKETIPLDRKEITNRVRIGVTGNTITMNSITVDGKVERYIGNDESSLTEYTLSGDTIKISVQNWLGYSWSDTYTHQR